MKEPILVGDIGSTKSTWYYSDTAPPLHLHGYNPTMHAESHGDSLFHHLREHLGGISFESVWYYGAGVIDHATNHKVRDILGSLFMKSHIHVASDLEGACRAACGHQEGIVAILGTGSHAAAWDGHKITKQAVSLGYILGDEGSGCDIGKAMIRGYFYQDMPQLIRQEMEEKLPGPRNVFLTEMMKSEAPNQFLAEYARVAVIHQDHPWVMEVVQGRLKLFIDRHIIPLAPESPVHIVGSIGSIFAGLMTAQLAAAGFTAGAFIKDPAKKLFERHIKQD